MKKLFILLTATLIILLSGCNENEFQRILKKVDFNQDIGLYYIDNSKDTDSLLLFASTKNLSDEEFNYLVDSNIHIMLMSDNNKLMLEPDNIEWKRCDPNLLKNGISLRLFLNKTKDMQEMVFKNIVFTSKKTKVTMKIQPIYLNVYTSEKNGISIMESPIAPQNKVSLNKNHSYAYKILDANGVITEDLEVEMFYPENVHNYIDISSLIASRDENTEKQIREDYKNTISEEELAKIKVYEVRCDYIVKKESNITFQPKIKIRFSEKEQDLVPFEPICFFNNTR